MYGPLVHMHCTDRAVKPESSFVPIENRPFKPPTTSLAGKVCDIDEHSSANTPSPHFRLNKEILDKDSRPSKECRKIVKVNGETYWQPVECPDDDFGCSPIAEKAL
jgi:hypothetical protein